MTGAWATLLSLLQRLHRNWPSKLVALVAAFLFWSLVATNSTSTTQRSFLLPLDVDGVEAGAVAVGVPDVVEVSVSGPSARVDRLRADQLRATLDLTDATAEFERQVQVQTPADVRLLHVDPEGVIGFLEQVASRELPVEPALLGSAPPGTELTGTAAPARVTLEGRRQALDQVTRAVALSGPRGGSVELVALDADGRPVPGVTFTPDRVAVTYQSTEVLRTKEVALAFTPPADPRVLSATVSATTVRVAGAPAALTDLASVPGTVEPPTGNVAAGRYTLPVSLTLPSGVVALDAPTATLQYAADSIPR